MRGRGVERTHAIYSVSHPQLQVILEILTDAAQILHDLDPEILQSRAIADAGQFEQLRRVDRTGAQDNFTARLGDVVDIVATIFNADATTTFEHDTLSECAGDDGQIRTFERGA